MNQKKFEYTHKDIPFLKKHLILRGIFCFLFLLVFTWQILSLFMDFNPKEMNIVQFIVGGMVLIINLLMSFISLMYAFKNFRIIL